MTRTAVLPLLVALGLLAVDALPAGAAEADDIWETLEKACAAWEVAHDGEIVAVTYADGGSHTTTVSVREVGVGLTLPAGGDGLARKYRLEPAGRELVLGRPVTGVEVHRTDGDALRERLWVDDATGVVLRRERYDGDTLLSLVAYERFDPRPPGSSGPRRSAVSVLEVDLPLPAELPGGYRLSGHAGLSGLHQAIRAAYDDGLYRVSVFAQPGRPDWDALPPGGRPVDGFPGTAYEWPGALPQRLVWETAGTTWTLVGDAPPEEFRALALALPQPEPRTPMRRLRTGLGRVWSSLSPFD